MDIDLVVKMICEKIPYLERFIRHINFEHFSIDKLIETYGVQLKEMFGYIPVAFLDEANPKIVYTPKLSSDFSFDEQVFIIAHEIFHYIIYLKKDSKKNSNHDQWLMNFIEDAQINQKLIKCGLTPPKDIVLLNDALNYEANQLYNMLFPYIKELKICSVNFNWTKNMSVADLIQNSKHKR